MVHVYLYLKQKTESKIHWCQINATNISNFYKWSIDVSCVVFEFFLVAKIFLQNFKESLRTFVCVFIVYTLSLRGF